MSKSVILVPLTGTVVVRDGNRVRPTIGKAFEYSAEEVEQLRSAGAKFRAPQNETVDEGEIATSTKAAPEAASDKPAKAAKKPAKAAVDDDL